MATEASLGGDCKTPIGGVKNKTWRTMGDRSRATEQVGKVNKWTAARSCCEQHQNNLFEHEGDHHEFFRAGGLTVTLYTRRRHQEYVDRATITITTDMDNRPVMHYTVIVSHNTDISFGGNGGGGGADSAAFNVRAYIFRRSVNGVG